MSADCIFCTIDRSTLAETSLSIAFLDGFPVSKGHCLVVPRRHVPSIWDLSHDEYADLFNLLKTVRDRIEERFKPQGMNVGSNCGDAAGQTIPHAHVHLIPRYAGDVTNPRGGIRNVIPGKGTY
jgi:ATP adenylyltransferase